MSAFSDHLESGIITHLFRTASFPKPPTLAIALCSGAPVDSDTGGSLVSLGKELRAAGTSQTPPGGYARQLLAPLDANWTFQGQVNGSGNVDNASDITFGPATVDWGTVTHVAILDSGVYASGNVLFHGPLQTAKTINNTDTFKFSAGDLDILLN